MSASNPETSVIFDIFNAISGAYTGAIEVSSDGETAKGTDEEGSEGEGKGDANSGGNDPYQYHGSQDRAYTMEEFINANKGLTRNEIINQLENRSETFMNSQQGGPSMRYVINPHDGKVLDMRHMLIIGKNPPAVGNLVEIGQWITGQASGMNPQDFYSNGVGYQFYMQSSSLQRLIAPRTFTDQLNNFFYSLQVIINW